jgi:mRNA interferase RelE/StbE
VAEYRLTISRSAIKELEELPSSVIERVRERIRSLRTEPRPAGSKKLHGRNDWRVRVGDYRVLYTIDDKQHVVDVGAIRHRSKAYE